MKAYAAMREANPRLRLVLVGDGPGRAALEALHPGCVFAGMRTGEDLVMHYASGDIFLFPSTTETYGNVTVEAMASGLAVVAYGYAAAALYIRHNVSGLVAGFGDAQAFTRLAVGLAGDRERVRRLGGAARAAAERVDWRWIVTAFEDALLELSSSDAAGEAHASLSA
jgi:glycosyltransferase involved in cell wall biosynthesis